jgi:hypothetical protein
VGEAGEGVWRCGDCSAGVLECVTSKGSDSDKANTRRIGFGKVRIEKSAMHCNCSFNFRFSPGEIAGRPGRLQATN